MSSIVWECFCDESYYGLWCVRTVDEKRWGHCFHVQTKEEAEGLRDTLNLLQEKASVCKVSLKDRFVSFCKAIRRKNP